MSNLHGGSLGATFFASRLTLLPLACCSGQELAADGSDTGHLSGCSHTYHSFCIAEWAKRQANTCPQCRARFVSITTNGKSKRVTHRDQVVEEDEEDEDMVGGIPMEAWLAIRCEVGPSFCPENTPNNCSSPELTAVQVCFTSENEDVLLLCDTCDAACHTYCADPVLDRVPTGEWFCQAIVAFQLPRYPSIIVAANVFLCGDRNVLKHGRSRWLPLDLGVPVAYMRRRGSRILTLRLL